MNPTESAATIIRRDKEAMLGGRITLTRDLAWAAAKDAGNRSMRRAGRTVWNEDDYNAATLEFERLWGKA